MLLRSHDCLFLLFSGCYFFSQLVMAQGVDCPTSDVLIENTTIYTADDDNWQVQAMAVKNGKIAFAGSCIEAQKLRCGAVKKILQSRL